MKKYDLSLMGGSSLGSAKHNMEKNSLSIVKVLLIPVTLRRWHHNYKSRKALLNLTAHQLEDIGLSRAQAQEEGNKPFWR